MKTDDVDMDVRVIRIYPVSGKGAIKAMASVTISEAGITVNGMRVYLDRHTGEPMALFPRQKDPAGKLFPALTIWNRRLASAVRRAVVSAYERLIQDALDIAS